MAEALQKAFSLSAIRGQQRRRHRTATNSMADNECDAPGRYSGIGTSVSKRPPSQRLGKSWATHCGSRPKV
jgi:hypothetical protein